ncbi:MAG: hypothetical protein LUE27_08265 [Clostridia bacterium]|nr:hypothetical protein [Clostridia bacterium]
MYTDSLFTEENLEGMKKLLKRICEGNPDSDEAEVRYCLFAMYDTVNCELMDQKKMEERMTELMDENGGVFNFYVISGLRYTPLIYFSAKENGQMCGPSLVYEGIEGDGVESEAMPVYTRKKMVAQDFSSFHWHHTDLDTVLAAAKESGFKYVIVNPDTTPVLLDIEKTGMVVSFFDDIDDCIDTAMADGIQAEELFPALVEKFFFRNVDCKMKDGSVVSGLVLLPEDDSIDGFELETDEDEDVIVRLEDLAMIRTQEEADYGEYGLEVDSAEDVPEDGGNLPA